MDTERYIADERFYCTGAQISLHKQRTNDQEFNEQLNQMISKVKFDKYYQQIKNEELIGLISKFTRENVLNDGNELNDLNSVAWHMGILCFVFEKGISHLDIRFEYLFALSWGKYFTSLVSSNVQQTDNLAHYLVDYVLARLNETNTIFYGQQFVLVVNSGEKTVITSNPERPFDFADRINETKGEPIIKLTTYVYEHNSWLEVFEFDDQDTHVLTADIKKGVDKLYTAVISKRRQN